MHLRYLSLAVCAGAVLPAVAALPIGSTLCLAPGLYAAERADGVRLVMERIDPEEKGGADRLAFWKRFASAELVQERAYQREWFDLPERVRNTLPLKYRGREHALDAGTDSFVRALNACAPAYEFWVAYATPAAIARAQDIEAADIEMYVSVTSAEGAPMTTHMGISRGFHRLAELARRPHDPALAAHPDLALALHSFAARVMLARDPAKLYMITAPVERMREILVRALPRDAFVGTSWNRARGLYEERQAKAPSIPWQGLEHRRLQARAARQALADQEDSKWNELDALKRSAAPAAAGTEALDAELRALQERKADLWRVSKGIRVAQESLECAEMRELAGSLAPAAGTSPILELRGPHELTLFGRDRKQVVFRMLLDKGVFEAGGQTYSGKAGERFRWFLHPHMFNGFNPLVTVHLEALAGLAGEDPDAADERARQERKGDAKA